MEPILCSLQTVLRGALILGLSLSSFAQLPAAPDTSGFPLGRKSPDFPLTALPPALIPQPAFEFHGIRIGDEMKQAERKFLSLRVASPCSKPGLCGSDGNSRIATCHRCFGYRGVRERDDAGSESGPDLRVPGPTRSGKHVQHLRDGADHEVRKPRQTRDEVLPQRRPNWVFRRTPPVGEWRSVHGRQRNRTRHHYREQSTRCANRRGGAPL